MRNADDHWLAPYRAQTPKRQRLFIDFLADQLQKEHWKVNQVGLTAGRTTKLTPSAVSKVPEIVMTVMGSENRSQAKSAVEGGTKYIREVTDAAAPR